MEAIGEKVIFEVMVMEQVSEGIGVGRKMKEYR